MERKPRLERVIKPYISSPRWNLLTLLIEDDDISTGEVNGVCGAQSGHCILALAMGDLVVAMVACDSTPDSPRVKKPGELEDLQPPPTTITLGAIMILSGCISDGEGWKWKGKVNRRTRCKRRVSQSWVREEELECERDQVWASSGRQRCLVSHHKHLHLHLHERIGC